jgi:hypothetical protein
MEPVSSNINKIPAKDGCTPISTSCVVWNGPDIPCIGLCKGDTIDKVVYDLAIILCDITTNVLDVSKLDFGCIIGEGECEPSTLLETLQAIIDKVCEPTDDVDPGDNYVEPLLPLPECLRYINTEGDLVTQLYHSEYTIYIAQKICDILLQIANITSIINNINIRLTEIEAILDGLDMSAPTISVTTQCLSYSTSIGQTLSIETAFTNLETRLCEYIAILGSISDWTQSLSSICINSTTPLPCGDGTYGDLPNWISSPTTAAASVNNLWVAFCYLNGCVSGGGGEPLPCEPIPITNLTIESFDTTTALLTWTAPAVPLGGAQPSGYEVVVYEVDTLGNPVGSAVYTTIITNPSATSINLASVAITASREYLVEIKALYSCGESVAAQVIGILKGEPILGYVEFEETVASTTSELCEGVVAKTYDVIEKQVRVHMTNSAGTAPLVNTGPLPLDFVFSLTRDTCSGTETISLTVSINPGDSEGFANYIASDFILCTSICTDRETTVTCLASWPDTTLLPAIPLGTTMVPEC